MMTEHFILALIDKFEAGSMREMELHDGATRLVLSKNFGALLSAPGEGAALPAGSGAAAHSAMPRSAHSGGPGAQHSPALSQAELDRALHSHDQGKPADEAGAHAGAAGTTPAVEIISSPLVGTFYAAPGPDSPAFVNKGSKVKKGDTLCILEAMKMMNKLEAEFDCEILEIKAQPGQLVEFEQALFEVRRNP